MRFGPPFAASVAALRLALTWASPLADLEHIQKPIGLPASPPKVQFEVYEQHDGICDAGSRQWTGWVDVSDEKRLFFWFFESRSKPAEDPVTVWINGGPGGSSMMGLFEEIGPCLVNEFGNGTVRNEFSWTNFSNVLFIDQPAGVGFSSIRNGTTEGVDNLPEAAADFDKFLATFFTSLFPQYSHLPFHIAGESFGGVYVPGFVDYIGKRQQLGVPGVFQTPIESIILVDAVISVLESGPIGIYDHMCRFGSDGNNQLKTGFNQTTCEVIEKAIPECQRLVRHCIDTYDTEICRIAMVYCEVNIEEHIGDDLGSRYPYDDRRFCDGSFPLCGMSELSEAYLNSTEVQSALGLKQHWNYSMINFDLNTRWQTSGAIALPTIREMTWILDETPTRVLAMQGNNDIVVNTEGQKRVYDGLPWGHQASYRLEKFTDWFWPDSSGKLNKGGEFKGVDKLAFITLDEAGHTSPGDQREAAAFVVKCWMYGAKDEACSFFGKRTDTLPTASGASAQQQVSVPEARRLRFW